MKVIQEEKLQVNADNIGKLLKEGLEELKKQYNCIGDVRGQGLFLGVEFITKEGKPDERTALFVKEYLKERFILVGTDGPSNNVIKIKPPLSFNSENAKHLLKKVNDALALPTSMHSDIANSTLPFP